MLKYKLVLVGDGGVGAVLDAAAQRVGPAVQLLRPAKHAVPAVRPSSARLGVGAPGGRRPHACRQSGRGRGVSNKTLF